MTDTLPGTISTVHGYDLPLGRDEVWEQISALDNYRSWWPWLRRFDARSLAAGEEWRCEVQPPLPYIVRFQVAIEKVDAPALVHALVLGDVVGDATLGARGGRGRLPSRPAQRTGPGKLGPPPGVPLCRPVGPLRARLGARFGGPSVHRPRRAAAAGRLISHP